MGIVWREHTAERLNAVVNHPVVRPWVADEAAGVLDMTETVASDNTILLMGEYGGCLCFKMLPGVYEVHTQVVPEGRGQWALDFVRAGAHWMFTHTDAFEILTRVPRGHTAAKALTLAAGMNYEFTRPDGCRFRERVLPVDIYGFRIQDWVNHAQGLVERGAWFHDRLHAEAARLGIEDKPHGDDENHNRYVGATYDMVAGGQAGKAVTFYNRWALAARHPTIALISREPPVVRFDIGLLAMRGGDIEVIREI